MLAAVHERLQSVTFNAAFAADPREAMFPYDDTEDDDRPLTERDLPAPKDVYDSAVDDDDEPDLGWMYDRRWTPRRILITALLVLALLALVGVSIIGVFELLFAPGAPAPTLPPLPRV